MGQLCVYLPPFTPDYSGVCSALFGMNCLIVINDPSCCTSNFVFYDEPRWQKSPGTVFSTNLRNIDAILGCDDKIIRSVRRAAEDIGASMIALVGTPVPAITGMDMAGIAAEIEAETGIETFGFNTSGFHFYDKGIAAAGKALIDRYAVSGAAVRPRVLNILGVTPLDFGLGNICDELRHAFSAAGWEVGCCLFADTDIAKIRNIGEAEINLAVSSSGVLIAKHLKKIMGTPYLAALPIGDEHLSSVLKALEGNAENTHNNVANTNASTLIIADQIAGNSMRAAMRLGGGTSNIDVASFFGWSQEHAESGDISLASEKQLIALLRTGRYHSVIGDPILSDIPEMSAMTHHKIPHPAVSSRLYWDDDLSRVKWANTVSLFSRVTSNTVTP